MHECFSGTARQRARRVARAPLGAIRAAALHDPDPLVRRQSLFFLDHYANDSSLEVFAQALEDPDESVRTMALHSLACESCKAEELCTADVVPGLVAVLTGDSSHELRSKAIPLLYRLSPRDSSAWAALERAALEDPDPVIRRAASSALGGRFVAPRKRYERRQRRHAKSAASSMRAAR